MTEPAAADPENEDLFDVVDEEHENLADERAEADVKAGRLISNEAVMRWVKSWGTPEELPPPKCGE